MNLPTKPIQSVSINFSGDMSVGIFPSHYEAEVFIDLNCLAEADRAAHLEEIRKRFFDLYDLMNGDDKPLILFDFELEDFWSKQDYTDFEKVITESEKD